MTPELFIQLFINALVIGLVYIFVVLGLDVILRITNILNFAHGEFYMLGAYAFLGTYKLLGLNAIVSLFQISFCLAQWVL
jgi:branched-chain amino acid transport system permease protein